MEAQRPTCRCGAMDRLASSGVYLVSDPPTGELAFPLANGNGSPARYCFACGGMLRSRPGSLQTTPSESEINHVIELLGRAGSLGDVEEVLGPPQEEFTSEGISFAPGDLRFRRHVVYNGKWESFDLLVIEVVEGGIRLLSRPKLKLEGIGDLPPHLCS
jgi:hypothetical protein